MNGQELFDIVRDVPREAWPLYARGRIAYYEDDKVWDCPADAACLMFEASMMRWLGGKIKPYPKGNRPVTIQNCGDHWHVNDSEHSGSLIEALAVACKSNAPPAHAEGKANG